MPSECPSTALAQVSVAHLRDSLLPEARPCNEAKWSLFNELLHVVLRRAVAGQRPAKRPQLFHLPFHDYAIILTLGKRKGETLLSRLKGPFHGGSPHRLLFTCQVERCGLRSDARVYEIEQLDCNPFAVFQSQDHLSVVVHILDSLNCLILSVEWRCRTRRPRVQGVFAGLPKPQCGAPHRHLHLQTVASSRELAVATRLAGANNCCRTETAQASRHPA